MSPASHSGWPASGQPIPVRAPGAPGRPTGAASHKVICPVCRESIPWVDKPTEVWEWVINDGTTRYNRVDLSRETLEAKRSLRRSKCYVVCPAAQQDLDERHYVPADYYINGKPIVVGLVGRPNAGKTHLLVAMLSELFRGTGGSYGLTQVNALDVKQHLEFEQELMRPFLADQQLSGTGSSVRGQYAETVQVTTPVGPRTIVFFDIAGDDFRLVGADNQPSEFLLAVNAVLFVEDIGKVASPGNEWVTGALSVLKHVPDFEKLPVAVVLAKADQQRFTEPVDRWLREPPPESGLGQRFREESRDVFAWLHRSEAAFLMGLVETFARCTLHFASASGGAAEGDRFPRGVRPTRVLEPLVALLAMTGAFPDRDGDMVGR